MAVNAVKGVNVTKFDAGGSGDNYIPDGYIKSVEKIWMDNYTLTAVITLTNTSIALCTLPKNKKITSIDILIETSASQTNGTISVGFTTDANIDTLLGVSTITHNLTQTSISLPYGFISASGPATVTSGTNVTHFPGAQAGFQKVTSGTQVTIALKLNNWTMTTGTVKSIVRYT